MDKIGSALPWKLAPPCGRRDMVDHLGHASGGEPRMAGRYRLGFASTYNGGMCGASQ